MQTSNIKSIDSAHQVDFEHIANVCLSRAYALVIEWLPEGRREGHEWVALNPTRADTNPGSFKVNLVTGQWADFATSDKGGDLISLYGYLYGYKNGQAATALAERFGISQQGRGDAQPSQKTPAWTPITPIPDDAPVAPTMNARHGKITGKWTYHDADGRPVFYVCRFDTPEGKQILPLSYCQDATGQRTWRWQGVDVPRPLYHLNSFANREQSRVVICEGEKAVDAALLLMPGWIATTSPNGSNAAGRADWSPVAGRNVLIWPDADEPGKVYADAVAELCRQAGAASVSVMKLDGFGDVSPGWDAADALAEGWKSEDVLEMASASMRRSDGGAATVDMSAIRELAELDDLAYERARVDAAKALGIHRVAVLDKLVKKLRKDSKRPAASGEQRSANVSDEHLVAASRYDLDDHGNAERLMLRRGDDIKCCTEWSDIIEWNGKYWQKGAGAITFDAYKDMYRRIKDESAFAESEEHAKLIYAHAKKSGSERATKSAINLLKVQGAAQVRLSKLDSQDMQLNCANGTIDLTTGELLPHSREDLHTKMSPVEYDPNAECPVWEQFLIDIFDGDHELIEFIQRAVGYSLTGTTSEQCLMVAYGHGANGKSTFSNIVSAILGKDYAAACAPGLLMKKNFQSHPAELAALYGVRFATSSESGEFSKLDETRLKQITGEDAMMVRRMGENFWEFTPKTKLWMATNHRPIIRGTDHGIWRRIKMIPFTVTIPEEKRDKYMQAKLMKELPGILAWAVRGCLDWQRQGLNAPAKIVAATQEYRESMDSIGAFLEECCEMSPEYRTSTRDLYAAYKAWALDDGEYVLSKINFTRKLTERGIEKGHWNHKAVRGFLGIRVGRDENPDVPF